MGAYGSSVGGDLDGSAMEPSAYLTVLQVRQLTGGFEKGRLKSQIKVARRAAARGRSGCAEVSGGKVWLRQDARSKRPQRPTAATLRGDPAKVRKLGCKSKRTPREATAAGLQVQGEGPCGGVAPGVTRMPVGRGSRRFNLSKTKK